MVRSAGEPPESPAPWGPAVPDGLDLSAVVTRAVDAVRRQMPEYEQVPLDSHRRDLHDQFADLLAGLAGRRLPDAGQLDRARELGRQRAAQGLPVEAVIGAFHVGYQEMWNALLSKARTSPDGAGADRLLLEQVNNVWNWIRLVTSAAADAYAEAAHARQLARASLGRRFLHALGRLDTEPETAVTTGHALGFDTDGPFQAVCAVADQWDDERLGRLQRLLDLQPGVAHVTSLGVLAVVLLQRQAASAAVAAMYEIEPRGPVGVGLERPALAGAEASIVDAEQSLAVAVSRGGGTAEFERDWFAAVLLPQRQRLEPLLAAGVRVAREHPHLSESVVAYARGGLSVTGSARALHLHPNTQTYRLDRWEELTGWDARTADGLLRSLAAIEAGG